MAVAKKDVPVEIVEIIREALSTRGTYEGSWINGKIDEVTIGTCSANNHAQDESGVAATAASITDHDPSTDFYVFGFHKKTLLWVKLIGPLHSFKIEDNRAKMFCPHAENDKKKQRSHTRTYYLDPKTGKEIREEGTKT